MIVNMAVTNVALYLILMSLNQIDGFSYNINAKTIFSPTDDSNTHAYFGYTTLLRGGKDPLILVGAPHEEINHPNYTQIKNPGTVYKCAINTRSIEDRKCKQMIFDNEGNVQISKSEYFRERAHHQKDGMLLGMSLDHTSHGDRPIVVCAPRWMNYRRDLEEYHALGICYYLSDVIDKVLNVTTLLPLLDNRKVFFEDTDILNYLNGQAGFSSHFSNEGTELLLGSPGILNNKGSVVKYELKNNKINISSMIVANPSEIDDDSYLGYSIGSGRFNLETKDLYVAGAPRFNYKGIVLIFDFLSDNSETIVVKKRLEGEQIGEYFGATILNTDINGDNLTDIIVGSPMYHESRKQDMGKISVYMNSKDRMFSEKSTLCGSCSPKARFGTSMSEIGDINGDGFKDIAVGAPYEEGTGAVYIYLGRANGLDPNYAQRITINGMNGFGISISKGVDIDNNSCNDLAIGAFKSEKVVLLRCHSSFNVTPRITTTPVELFVNTTNFITHICAKTQGSYPAELRFNVTIDEYFNRAVMIHKNDSSFILKATDKNEECKNISLLAINVKDYSRPFIIKTSYQLHRDPMKEGEFCSDCPVLRPGSNTYAYQVPIAVECGVDNICQPDLKIGTDHLNKTFIIGYQPAININIKFENVGESAFLPRLQVVPPKNMSILKIPSECRELVSILECEFENPFLNGAKKILSLEYDTALLKNSDEELLFNITATTGGDDVNLDNNNLLLKIALENDINIDIEGKADPILFFNPYAKIEQNDTASNYSYEIINEGPTILDSVVIRFYLPVILHGSDGTNLTLANFQKPTAILNHRPLRCYPISGSYSDNEDNNSDADDLANRKRDIRSALDYDLFIDNIYNISSNLTEAESDNAVDFNCRNSNYVTCLIVECTGKRLIPGNNGVKVFFQMKYNTTAIEIILRGGKSITMTTYAMIVSKYIKDQFNYQWTSTVIKSNTSPPIPLWIMAFGVLIGIIILLGIIFAFYKCGFFKRKTKEEMESILKDSQIQ